ncbi:hypothetical protein HDE78_001495 [Rhodanobacter sp. K2T2]|uniref:hypothetical protein n=1 Tax=Rhodanobacter sp. K2T2 TaxID=2723085 RepID=UPI0015CA1C93|nr:hypothetical protein [Rhodanobacter sp. K2T2]NYE28543.1 hypothetical protein [Rhodanobacter sp. K2T2]
MDVFDDVLLDQFSEQKHLAGLVDSQRKTTAPVSGASVKITTTDGQSKIFVLKDGQPKFVYRHIIDDEGEAKRLADGFQAKFDLAARYIP